MPSVDPESNETAPPPTRADTPPPTAPAPLAPAPLAPAAPPGLSDLLLLARALMREGSSETAPPVAPGQARGPLPKEQKKFYKLGNLPAAPPAPAPAAPPPPAAPVAAVAPVTPAVPAPVAPTPVFLPPPGANDEPKISGEAKADPATAPLPSPAPGGEAVTRRWDPLPIVLEERVGGRRRAFTRRQRNLMIGLGVIIALASFLAGQLFGWLSRPTAAKTPKAGADNPAGTPAAVADGATFAASVFTPDEGLRRALATIDEAEVARAAKDWARMDALLEQAGREAGPRGVPGLLFRRAENAVRRGDLNAANVLVNSSLEKGEEVAKTYALRAVIANRAERPKLALPMLEAASRADPFDGRYLFYQAQSLRAQGKLQEARVRLQRALDRVEELAQGDNYRLVLRLTLLELGEEGGLSEEIAGHLAQPSPEPGWLVVAGARECQAGRFQEGYELLRRAFNQAGPTFAILQLSDPFFRRFTAQPELAPLFAQYLPPPPAPPPPPPALPTPTPGLLTPGTQLPFPTPPTLEAASPSPQP